MVVVGAFLGGAAFALVGVMVQRRVCASRSDTGGDYMPVQSQSGERFDG